MMIGWIILKGVERNAGERGRDEEAKEMVFLKRIILHML